MNDIATHMRITGLAVSNDDVDSRRAASAALRTTWSKEGTVRAILLKAQDVANSLRDGVPSPALAAEVQKAVQKKASAFLSDDRPLEVSIVAGLAAYDLVSKSNPDLTGWVIADVWAAALWSALSFQTPMDEPKRESLRAQVLDAARTRCVEGAKTARKRVNVPDFGKVKEDGAAIGLQFHELTNATIDALRRNAALDREELDFLWWALANRSRLLRKRLGSLDEPTRLIAAAIDASALMRRFPCDVHRELVLSNLDADPVLDLPELLAALGDFRAALAMPFESGIATEAPDVFPVLSAMIAGNASGDATSVKRPSSEYAERVLLEATLAKLKETGALRL